MLERDMWGDDDEDVAPDRRVDAGVSVGDGMFGTDDVTGAVAGGSR
jgi:hypothetical protein